MMVGALTMGRIIFRDHLKFYHAFPKDWEFAEFAHKYWVKYEAIVKKKHARLKAKNRVKTATYTDLMDEALCRGYVSCLDIEAYDPQTYVLWHPILNMVYKTDYAAETTATDALTRFGIPGTIIKHITKKTKTLK